MGNTVPRLVKLLKTKCTIYNSIIQLIACCLATAGSFDGSLSALFAHEGIRCETSFQRNEQVSPEEEASFSSVGFCEKRGTAQLTSETKAQARRSGIGKLFIRL